VVCTTFDDCFRALHQKEDLTMSCSTPDKRYTLLLLPLAWFVAGCAGEGEEVCARALQHLEACTGVTLQELPDTCDPEQARALLETGCSALAEAGTRGMAFFGGWLSEFFDDLLANPYVNGWAYLQYSLCEPSRSSIRREGPFCVKRCCPYKGLCYDEPQYWCP
jgi:hypothetical protein